MPPDLIVYAVVTAGLIFWLRSILGTKHGDEKERPNPLSPPPENADNIVELSNVGDADVEKISTSDQIHALAQNPTQTLFIDNKTAENGLLSIAKLDNKFDIHFFMSAIQDVFVMVVEGFAKNEKETLQSLMAKDVFEAFEQSMNAREDAKEQLSIEIHAIKKVEIIEASEQKNIAYITIRFTAEETRVHKDNDGEILSGDPDQINKMRDIWTFGRDLKSNDPKWLVYQTRSDDEDDNDIIPNTDG